MSEILFYFKSHRKVPKPKKNLNFWLIITFIISIIVTIVSILIYLGVI